MSEPVPTCTLSAVELRARREELRDGLARGIRAARALPDGIALCFDASDAAEEALSDFIRFEEQCCGFARYATRRAAAGLWLEIRGPEGTRDLFAPMAQAQGIEVAPESGAPPRRSLLRWGGRSTLAAILLVVLCETPFLALGLAAFGMGGSAALLSGWLDGLAAVLLFGGLAALALAARHAWRVGRRDRPA